MNEEINNTLRRVKSFYTLFWLLPIAMVVVGETSDTWTGIYADDANATYLGEITVIILTITGVPAALKLFSWVMTKHIDRTPIEEALRLYVIWSGVRIALLALPVLSGLAVYYTALSTQSLLCACIGLIASLFCIPGLKRLKQELHIEHEE